MAPIYLGSTEVSKIYKGNTELAQAYLGDTGMLSTITPSEHFKPVIYSGNSSSQTISGVGFQPDFVWLRSRTQQDNHYIMDSNRGAAYRLYTNMNLSEMGPDTNRFNSFNSDGFALGSDNSVNMTGEDYVAWCWKANGGTTSTNTEGDVNTTVQVNETAGFSIVTWTGGSSATQTTGHGLSSAPEFIIQRPRNTSSSWYIYHKDLPSNKSIRFDTSGANTDLAWVVNSSTFETNWTNTSYNWLAYCFHSVDGYSKFGSYTGTGNTGLEVTLGFQARWIMVAKYSPGGDRWLIADTVRHAATNNDAFLDATSDLNERDFNCTNGLTFGTNSFTINTTDGTFNSSGGSYLYFAFA